MRGRDLIEKYSKVIELGYTLYRITPNFLSNILLQLFVNSESKIALLLRYFYVRKNSNSCGNNVYIGSNVILKNIKNLDIGSNVSIHANCYIDAVGGIIISDNVSIANQCSLISFEHTWSLTEIPIKYNPTVQGRIIIEEDVWIGCGCRILSDVTIKERSIVAAGAIVNKSIDSNVIVGGVPAKVIKIIQ